MQNVFDANDSRTIMQLAHAYARANRFNCETFKRIPYAVALKEGLKRAHAFFKAASRVNQLFKGWRSNLLDAVNDAMVNDKPVNLARDMEPCGETVTLGVDVTSACNKTEAMFGAVFYGQHVNAIVDTEGPFYGDHVEYASKRFSMPELLKLFKTH